MVKRITKSVAWILLTVVLVNGFVWSSNPKAIAHELDHNAHLLLGPAGDHLSRHTYAHPDRDPCDLLSECEHAVLHSLENLSPSPPSTAASTPVVVPRTVASWLAFDPIPYAPPERLFRPPRYSTLN